jgi:CheY-like chemotaxis protein
LQRQARVETQENPPRGVLLIDDSLGQLAMIRQRLEAAGYAPVRAAADWTECRQALATFAPALVIVDVQLPGMISGDIMATQLRRHPSCRGAKILFHSGVKERDLAALTARAEADGYVAKGNLDALVSRVLAIAPPAATLDERSGGA